MKYMVIENFKPGKTDEIYARFKEKGRMLPQGLKYLDSWITVDRKQCFQLMEAENIELFEEWINNWKDLTDFQVFSVQDSPTKVAQQNDKRRVI
ncbi:MAG: DUF3303 family protein [Candidatus Riflebacteria bacterium]|nr:DUF3303 family protein [Candidatus Riflebacteria bacterium]